MAKGSPFSLFLFVLIIIIAALQLEARVPMKTFHYVKEWKSWLDAQQHCQEIFTDLASVSTHREDLLNQFEMGTFAWIGLYRDPGAGNASVWRWTGERGDASSDTNWARGQTGMRSCTVIDKQLFHNLICSVKRNFYCSDNEDNVVYFPLELSWFDAQESCKDESMFLATVTQSNYYEFIENGWVGLHVSPNTTGIFTSDDIWKWTGKDSDYRKWAKGKPRQLEHCGHSFYHNRWVSGACSQLFPFFCFADNVILVKENKTWEEALEHCRAIGSVDSGRHNHYRDHQYDLVSLQSEDDHRYARDKTQEATTNEVWTALRFLAGQWLWVDGEPQQYQDLPLCPAWARHCGTLPKDHSTTQWQIRDCMERRNFLCIKSKQTE